MQKPMKQKLKSFYEKISICIEEGWVGEEEKERVLTIHTRRLSYLLYDEGHSLSAGG